MNRIMQANNDRPAHRHNTQYRGVKVTPRPAPDNTDYLPINYEYAGKVGSIHEVISIKGRSLAKVGFPDRKIVYYFIDDLEFDEQAARGTFHDQTAPPATEAS